MSSIPAAVLALRLGDGTRVSTLADTLVSRTKMTGASLNAFRNVCALRVVPLENKRDSEPLRRAMSYTEFLDQLEGDCLHLFTFSHGEAVLRILFDPASQRTLIDENEGPAK